MHLRNRQRGVSTLAITILLLVIITLVVLFSTSVGFIEQRTALNENRARIAEQAAEAGINMAGEYIKASRDLIISRSTNGWLDTVAGGAGWVTCRSKAATFAGGEPHPCMSEADPDRRAEMFFYTTDGVGASAATTYLPYGAINTVGAAGFASTVNVQAVLCRVDTTLTTPACRELPLGGNRITVTLISSATLTDENTNAVIKETWASFSTSAFSSAVPLVASGIVKGLGNSQIVASPNAGGFGVAASMWSPNNIGFGTKNSNPVGCAATGGLGSSSTCHVEDYLFGTTVEPSNIKTGCAGNVCGCPSDEGRYLSGHVGSDKAEGIDILDVDKIPGDPDYSDGFGPLPDIAFYPGRDCTGNQMDSDSDPLDDSLFEWTFGVDVVAEEFKPNKGTAIVRQDCSVTGSPELVNSLNNKDCAVAALVNDLAAQSVSCATLKGIGKDATGLYYVTDPGGCNFGANQIGSPTQSVVVVVEQNVDIGANFFGLLFVRSKNNTADVNIQGNTKLFGALVIEGDIKVTGNIDIVYEDVSVSSDPFTFPKSARFARVPGSWLDATTGF